MGYIIGLFLTIAFVVMVVVVSKKIENKPKKLKQAYVEAIAQQDITHPEYKKNFLKYNALIAEKLDDNSINEQAEYMWSRMLNGEDYNFRSKENETPETLSKFAKQQYEKLLDVEKSYVEYVKKECRSLQSDEVDMSMYMDRLTASPVKEIHKDKLVGGQIFVNRLKLIAANLQDRLDLAELYKEQGKADKVLTLSERIFLRRATKYIEDYKEKEKQVREEEFEAQRQAQHEEMMYRLEEQQRIATEQGKEIQHILKTGKGRSMTDVLFDTHEYKDKP